jgi:hypothetical protein
VRVDHRLVDGAIAQPELLIGSGARADQRMVLVLVPRDTPVVDPRGRADASQPAVEIVGLGLVVGKLLAVDAVVGLLDEGARAALAHHAAHGDHDHDARQRRCVRPPGAAPESDARPGQSDGHRDDRRRERQRDEHECQLTAFVGDQLRPRSGARERGGARRDPDGRRRRQRDERPGGDEREPPPVVCDGGEQAGADREHRAAAEREVHGRQEDRERGARGRSRRQAPGVHGEPQRQQRSHHPEQGEPGGVAERSLEAIVEDHDGAPALVGEEPVAERLDRQPRGARDEPAQQMRDRAAARDQQHREETEEVHQPALHLQDGRVDVRRPGDRRRVAADEQRQRAEQRDLESAERTAAARQEREPGDPGEREHAPAPGGGVIAAVSVAEQDDHQPREERDDQPRTFAQPRNLRHRVV